MKKEAPLKLFKQKVVETQNFTVEYTVKATSKVDAYMKMARCEILAKQNIQPFYLQGSHIKFDPLVGTMVEINEKKLAKNAYIKALSICPDQPDFVGKISLIKAYHQITGLGLKESKEAVDRAVENGFFIVRSSKNNLKFNCYFLKKGLLK